MSEFTSREFDYQPPVSAAEFIDDLLDDSIGPGDSHAHRREYIASLLANMYANSGLSTQMTEYAEVYNLAYQTEHHDTYGEFPVGAKVFDIGNKLAIHSLTAAVRNQRLRRMLRRGKETYFRTEFGLLHASLSKQQFVRHFGDGLAEKVASTRPDINQALTRVTDELYAYLPVEWQQQLNSDFLHGFHAADAAITQYIDSLMLDYQLEQPLDIRKLPLL